MFYQINAGPIAVQNRAVSPLKTMFDLAKLLDTNVIAGEHYGQDFIKAPRSEEEQQVVEQLLIEAKLPFEKVQKLPHNLAGYSI